MKYLGYFLFLVQILLFASCKQINYYNVSMTAQPAEAGSVAMSPSSSPVLEGTQVSFKATPNGDYVFTGWSGSLSGTENPKTVTVTSDMTVTANFVLREYPLSISVEGEGTVSEKVISTKTDYPSGTVVELTAKAADHWLFDHWGGDLSGSSNPAQITISSEKTVKAVFVKKMYDLTVTIEGEGSVQEKVVETKGSYQEGTAVELTATPAAGWSFDHWEGDLAGTDSPVQITITSPKSVKAVFTKNHYAYNLTIVGPGVVDEYLVEDTKASLEYGTKVLLKAYPADGAIFKGWSGDLSGTETEVVVNINSVKSITAEFERQIKHNSLEYPLPDLMQPWYKLKDSHYGLDFSYWSFSAYRILVVDYNRDGLLDIIMANYDGYGSMDRKYPIRFYLGQTNGTLIPDEKNDSRIQGMIHIRKMIYGDYNEDGYPDICLIGHGYDTDPWGGEYPVLLMSNPDGFYKDIRFTDYVSFYHGGSQGDYDNDGDLDIFIVGNFGHSGLLINDGSGNFIFNEGKVHPNLFVSMFNAEFYDFDGDGLLDLICGGHDWEDDSYWHDNDASYSNPPIIFWGNGDSYNTEDYSRLLGPSVDGYGVVCDFYFKDLNNDGIDEIIIARTGDGLRESGPAFYEGWSIQVLERNGHVFHDVTNLYFENITDSFQRDGVKKGWIVWLDMREIEGKMCLIGSMDSPDYPTPVKLFEFVNGKFVRIKDETTTETLSNGVCIYDDEINVTECSSIWGIVDFAYNETPYKGDRCIQIPEGWNMYTSVWFRQNHYQDYSILYGEDYYLEFCLKNSDPSLKIHIKFEHFTDWSDPEIPSMFYELHADNTRHDGTWEIVRIPLSSFNFWWPANPTGYLWDKIDQIEFITVSDGGSEFYLDEIRIRKVLPEE